MLKLFRFYTSFLSLLVFNRLYYFLNGFASIFLNLVLSFSFFSIFFQFLRLSYLLWLDTLIIDFLQKKSFYNFVKSYILLSPDFIESFIFKFISNPLTLKISSVYRTFTFKESSSTYSFLSMAYFTITLLIVLVLLTHFTYYTLLF